MKPAWTDSKVEEAIAALHWIAAILCFAYGFNFVAWIFLARGVFDEAAAIAFGVREIRAEKSQERTA